MTTAMSELLVTPKNGHGYVCDVLIDVVPWLERVFDGCDELPIPDGIDWDSELDRLISGPDDSGYVMAARDNVCNHENDFSDVFTYSIWIPANRRNDDWCWDDGIIVAVCVHRGGDPRNNDYDSPRAWRVDAVADTGFLDWVYGWYVERLKDGEWVSEDDYNEQCSIGYSSNPSCQLVKLLEGNGFGRSYGESGDWLDGTFRPYADAHGERLSPIRCTPYVNVD